MKRNTGITTGFGLLALSLIAGTADAEILTLRCDRQSADSITNVYRYDIVIDLLRKTVREQQFTTFKENDRNKFIYRNHKANANEPFDDDQYVLVSDERIKWGDGKPADKGTTYDRHTNVLNDGLATFQCKDRGNSSAPAK